MRYEVIFCQTPLGQQISCVVEAESFDEAGAKARAAFAALGKVVSDEEMPLPVTIRWVSP